MRPTLVSLTAFLDRVNASSALEVDGAFSYINIVYSVLMVFAAFIYMYNLMYNLAFSQFSAIFCYTSTRCVHDLYSTSPISNS
jgi:hypothetical protein